MERIEPTVAPMRPDTVARLTRVRPSDGKVLSLFVDLDPTRFATPEARRSQLRSLRNEALRAVDNRSLSHNERDALIDDVHRSIDHLDGALPFNGAGSVAVFCCTPARLFDVVRLPAPVASRAVVGDGPFVEPLAQFLTLDEWCVLLVNRSAARVLRGTSEGLREVQEIHDDVHGRHAQGGWSQARYERSVGKEVQDHLKHAAGALFAAFERAPFDHLVAGTPAELLADVRHELHPYLLRRLRGRIQVDVEHSSREDVLEAVRPLIEEQRRRHEADVIDALRQELATGGRAAGGREDVRRALEERRVQVLVLRPGAEGAEEAIELAVQQAADVLVVRHHRLELPVAALLRF